MVVAGGGAGDGGHSRRQQQAAMAWQQVAAAAAVEAALAAAVVAGGSGGDSWLWRAAEPSDCVFVLITAVPTVKPQRCKDFLRPDRALWTAQSFALCSP